MPDLDDPPGSLRSVITQLGPLVVDRRGPDGGGDRPVASVAIDDPGFPSPFHPDCIVLGVGAVDDAAVGSLVDRAVAAGATAVFVKRRRDDAPAPGADRITVVTVSPDLSWEQLHGFARTALLAAPVGRPGAPQTLFDVANRLAVLVDGAIVIEDEHLRVLAYSSLDHPVDDARRATIMGRQIPGQYVTEIRDAGVTAHLVASAEPVRYDLTESGMLPRLAIALRSGGRTVGLVWAIIDDEREAAASRVLADAAPDLAIEVVRHLTAEASRASDRLAAATQLLDGRPVSGLRQLLGADASDGFVVLSLQPVVVGGHDDADTVGRVADFASVYLDAFRVPALVAPVTLGQVDIVVGLSSRFPAVRARALLDELRDRALATFGLELDAAMGAPVPDVRRIPTSRRDAIAVLDVLRSGLFGVDQPSDAPRRRGTAAGYDEVRGAVALVELGRLAEGAEHLRRGPLAELMASDVGHDRRLVETVHAWLDSGGDVAAVAAELGVHRNTVRYRLAGFEEATELDLADPVIRLVAHLQLVLGSRGPSAPHLPGSPRRPPDSARAGAGD